jgi:tetratricopeptide (TPR) repeat protein
MFEAQVQEVNKKLDEAIEAAKQDIETGISAVDAIIQELDQIVPMESNEYYECKCNLYEVSSDFRLMAQKFPECEANLKEMLKAAMELYKRDEDIYCIRVSTAYFKLGALGRVCNGLGGLLPEPRVLSEDDQKIYDAILNYYKLAIRYTIDRLKEGHINVVTLHATALEHMSVLYANVGNYNDAVTAMEQSINFQKAIYEKRDDRTSGIHLAMRMNILSNIYNRLHDMNKVIEVLEDSIFVLEELEESDPLNIKILLCRHCLNLAGAYTRVREEASKAPAMYQKGVNKIEEAEKINEKEALPDVIMANYLSAQYFFVCRRNEICKHMLRRTIECGKAYKEMTGSTEYDNFVGISTTLLGRIIDEEEKAAEAAKSKK